MHPEFDAPTVLVSDHFDYVELWLKRNSNQAARLSWQQAENFYRASLEMPNESRPIAAYYCMLNAAKALLEAKGIAYLPFHG
ncbi:MAG: YaaC family protein, partial [Algiphilus sp.]